MKKYSVSNQECKKFFGEADKVLPNTYPEPNKVVCALLTKSRKIFTGVSYHTDTLTATMHAEMVALAHAAVHGEKEIIAITGPNCHICKQLLWESAVRSGIDPIIIFKKGKFYEKIPLSSMMFYVWPELHG